MPSTVASRRTEMTGALQRRLARFRFDPAFNLRAEEVERAAASVERRLGGTQAEVLPEDADQLYRRVRSEWQERGDLHQFSRRTRRWFPHFTFYPPGEPDVWLARDPRYRDQIGPFVLEPRNSRVLASLCHAFLRAFPLESPVFDPFSRICGEALRQSTRLRTKALRLASERYDAFTRMGPARVAESWLQADASLEDFRSAPEVTVLGTDSRFARSVSVGLLSTVQRYLDDGAALEPAWLDAKLRIIPGIRGGRSALDPGLRDPLAEALLKPFVTRVPPPAFKEWARPFLLAHLDDPRRRKVSWSSVSDAARGVMLRWLVEDTIDQFFHVLDKTALDRHWKDRKAFWEGYVHKGAIHNAWVILGNHASRFARRTLDDDTAHFGRLTGAEGSQSVLLMQFGPSLVAAEWSHSGACHFWDDPGEAPPFFGSRYSGIRLRRKSVTKVNHIPQHDPARWQRKIADTIEYYSNIRHPIQRSR